MEDQNNVISNEDFARMYEESIASIKEKHPALFIVMPTHNHWKLRCIPPSWNKRMEMRKPLPKQWAGLHEKQLQEVTKIEGAIFCHKGRFISFWKTKEDALKAAHLALEQNNEDNI